MLHTSDWHVGKQIRGHTRADEHRAVLAEIAQRAGEASVDLVIVAGDLFDTASPSAESEQIVYDTLLDLADTGAHVAVIAGNHDHPRRLAAVAPLLSRSRVHLVATPTRPDDGGVIKLTFDDVEVHVAMLPFVSKRGIVRAADLMDAAAFENAQSYTDRLRQLIEAMCASFSDASVNILVNHSFVLGGQTGGGERPVHLVDEYAVTAASFPASVSYGALGHLHRAQRIAGPAPLHYCGSPLQLDFGEIDDAKQVNLVTAEPGAPARVEPIPLSAGRRLRTIRGPLDQVMATEVDDDVWVRVVLEGEVGVGAAQHVRDALGEPVVDVRVDRPLTASRRAVVDHRAHTPRELFTHYLEHEGVTDDRVASLFAALLDESVGLP